MSAVLEPRRHKLSIDEYERLWAADVLPQDVRVELIEGDMIDMAPMGLGHLSIGLRLTRLFVQRAGTAAVVSPGYPIALPPWSMPEPDFTLLRPRADDYAGLRPGAADALLVVEISESSLRFDTGTKARVYASHGIAEYWVIDVANRRLVLHREPRGDGGNWGLVRTLEPPFSVAPQALVSLTIASDDIWPQGIPG